MIVTQIEEVTKSRYKVFLDEQFAFVLYRGELSRFHMKKGQEVTQEDYDRINRDVVLKRAKKRLLHLLDQMPRTEQQLRVKMKQNFYTEDMIEEAIQYAMGYGYINDKNYANMYIQDKINRKSKKELYCALLQKGIEKEIIQEVLEELYEEHDDLEAIRMLIRKKNFKAEEATEKDRQKLYGYLMRKGFSYTDVESVIREYSV